MKKAPINHKSTVKNVTEPNAFVKKNLYLFTFTVPIYFLDSSPEYIIYQLKQNKDRGKIYFLKNHE